MNAEPKIVRLGEQARGSGQNLIFVTSALIKVNLAVRRALDVRETHVGDHFAETVEHCLTVSTGAIEENQISRSLKSASWIFQCSVRQILPQLQTSSASTPGSGFLEQLGHPNVAYWSKFAQQSTSLTIKSPSLYAEVGAICVA